MSHHEAQSVIDVCEHLGVALPKAVADAAERRARLVKVSNDLTTLGVHEEIENAILAEAERGKDPTKSPRVQQLVTKAWLAAYETQYGASGARWKNALSESGTGVLRMAIEAHTDDILNAWRTPFMRSAARLAEIHEQLGDVDLDDSEALFKLGATQREVPILNLAQEARDVRDLLVYVGDGTESLAKTGQPLPRQNEFRALIFANIPPEVWGDSGLEGRFGVDPWALIRAGHELDLASPSEWRARVQAVLDYQEQVRKEQVRAEHQRATEAPGRRDVAVRLGPTGDVRGIMSL